MYRLTLVRLLGVISAGFVSGCARASGDKPTGYDAIYRYINVGRGERINLGGSFEFPELGTYTDDTTIVLHRDAVVDPDSIRLFVDSTGVIYAMDFVYRANESFSGLLATYTKTLGPPTKPGDRQVQWDDGITNFTIRWTGGDTVGSLGSRLTDLQNR